MDLLVLVMMMMPLASLNLINEQDSRTNYFVTPLRLESGKQQFLMMPPTEPSLIVNFIEMENIWMWWRHLNQGRRCSS